jgi:hypothetical protein
MNSRQVMGVSVMFSLSDAGRAVCEEPAVRDEVEPSPPYG